MPRHSVHRGPRRLLAALGAGAVLAAVLTGTAAAQDPPSLNCAQAQQKLAAAQEAATDPDGPGKPADGTVITATEAAQIQAAIASAIDPAGPGNDDGVPPAVPPVPASDGGTPGDPSDDTPAVPGIPADTGDGAEITPAEQVAIDAAEAAAIDPDGPGTPADGTVITDAEQGAIDDAEKLVNEACQGKPGEDGPQGEPGKDGVNAFIVLADKVCAEVILTKADGTLVRILAEIPCPPDCPPAPAKRPQVGDPVTRIVNSGPTVISPGFTGQGSGSGTYRAPVPSIVDGDLPVTG